MPATTIAIYSGNSQTQGIAAQLALPFVAVVTDGSNNPVSGVTVDFAITSAPAGATGQTLSAPSAVTDTDGKAQAFLTLGNQAGSYQVQAGSGSLTNSPLTFTAIGGAIVSLANVKQFLKLTDTALDDVLTNWIGLMSERIESLLEQPVTPRNVVDIVDGSGTPKQYANIGRIIALTPDNQGNVCQSVQYRTNTLSDWASILTVEGYLFVDPKDPWAVEMVSWAQFPRWIKNVRLSYLCGFQPIPADIVLMALDMVAMKYNDSPIGGAPRIGMTSRSKASVGSTATDSFKDMMKAEWLPVISKYRRIW